MGVKLNNLEQKARGDFPRISVIICTLNEEASLPQVLPKIPSFVDEVILVDGYSTDGTVDVAKKLCPRIKVLYQPGKGKGDALRYGIERASGDIIVTLDADGQTDPEDIFRFIKPLLQGYDFAKGSRLSYGRPPDMRWHRWVGNYLIVNTCNILYRTKFTDLCCGYNAFWRETLLKANPWAEDGWNYEPLLTARAVKGGLKIIEVSYPYRSRLKGRSNLPDWRQGLTAIKVLVRERFRSRSA